MNKEWSEKQKQAMTLMGKRDTFRQGIDLLIELRGDVLRQITEIVDTYPREAYYKMPYAGAKGYHSKTLAYSIWHIFRIEDIVVHTMIKGDKQVLFSQGYQERIGSPIITTGNELQGEAIADFSRKLDIQALYAYACSVKESTDLVLQELTYEELKRKFTEEDRNKLIESACVSTDEEAFWLIDYWCGKDLKGLLGMPCSRHWILHVEAMQRIKNRLCQLERKGIKNRKSS